MTIKANHQVKKRVLKQSSLQSESDLHEDTANSRKQLFLHVAQKPHCFQSFPQKNLTL